MTTQIKPFQSKEFHDLISQINEFNKINNGFSTQIFPPSPFSEAWFSAVYYEDKGNPSKQLIKSPQMVSKPVTNQSNKIIEKPTKEQINFLKFHNKPIPQTKREAWATIKGIKEQNGIT